MKPAKNNEWTRFKIGTRTKIYDSPPIDRKGRPVKGIDRRPVDDAIEEMREAKELGMSLSEYRIACNDNRRG